MDSNTFISEKLSYLSDRFNQYQYNYWFDSSFYNHFIEVIPSSFKKCDDFISEEVEIIDEFYNLFPSDSISFITNEELNYFSGLVLVEKYLPTKVVNWEKSYSYATILNFDEEIHAGVADYNYALAA